LGTGTLSLGDGTAPLNPITISSSSGLTGAGAIANSVAVNRDFTVGGSNNIEFSGGVTLATSPIITVSNTGTSTFSGTIGGTGFGITKAGAGTLTLTGANTYDGGTTISGGALLASNTTGSATGSGTVTVSTGGTLAGAGAISGAVVVDGGTLAPGASIESLDVGALSFNAAGTFAAELNTNASLTVAADLVNADGNFSIAAGALLSAVDLGSGKFVNGTKLTLISYDGTWNGGTFDTHPDDSLITVGANDYVINYNDTTGGSNFGGGTFTNYLTLTAIPEASVAVFGSLVCAVISLVHGGRKLLRRGAAV
jgi:autotransporter-associated beta strand protein